MANDLIKLSGTYRGCHNPIVMRARGISRFDFFCRRFAETRRRCAVNEIVEPAEALPFIYGSCDALFTVSRLAAPLRTILPQPRITQTDTTTSPIDFSQQC